MKCRGTNEVNQWHEPRHLVGLRDAGKHRAILKYFISQSPPTPGHRWNLGKPTVNFGNELFRVIVSGNTVDVV